jgi:N-acetylglutamate synthase-like GNAT family acetyltransferase
VFTLRPAVAADLEPVVALLTGCALPRAAIERDFPDGFIVAAAAGELVGVAGVEIHGLAGLLRSVAVAPAHRGRSLARTLTLDRIAWARARELAELWLLTTTAAPLFVRLGFTPAERASVPGELAASEEFARSCPSSATCMRLVLAAPAV